MKIKYIATIVFALLTFLSTCFADSDVKTKQGIWKGQEIEYVVGEILLKFKDSASPEQIQDLLDKYGAVIEEEIGHSGVKVLLVADTPNFLEKVKEMDGEPIVEYAEPNIIRYIVSVRSESWGYVKSLFAR